MERESFVFYKSWQEAIDLLPADEQAQAYRAIVRYACTGEESQFDGAVKIVLTMARPVIDTNNRKFEGGFKGGRPRKPMEKPMVSEVKTIGYENENHRFSENENENEKENVNGNEKENENGNENGKEIKEKTAERVPDIPCDYIIDYLNEKTGRHFKTTEKNKRLIRARAKEGYKVEDFVKVIDNKYSDWSNDQRMAQYLRPETLFGTKFDGYLNSEPARVYVSGDLPF